MFLPLALAALLLSPVVSRAGSDGASAAGGPEDSFVGALLTIACGAGIFVSRAAPHPIVIAVTVVTCVGAFVDAVTSPDPR